jgi:pSer/pThr/pTyr-binding forkhead associated (FHA) protein/predicted  nucleic acid-binding Zn-ribbon protein
MAKLIFILDDGEKVDVPLTGDITIGRVEGNDVVVDDPRISSQHAEVRCLASGGYEVRDLTSKAGTFVNGERVKLRILAHGDKVTFGPLAAEFEMAGVEDTVIAPSPPAEDDATEKALEREKEESKEQAGGKEKEKWTEKVKKGWFWGKKDKGADKDKEEDKDTDAGKEEEKKPDSLAAKQPTKPEKKAPAPTSAPSPAGTAAAANSVAKPSPPVPAPPKSEVPMRARPVAPLVTPANATDAPAVAKVDAETPAKPAAEAVTKVVPEAAPKPAAEPPAKSEATSSPVKVEPADAGATTVAAPGKPEAATSAKTDPRPESKIEPAVSAKPVAATPAKADAAGPIPRAVAPLVEAPFSAPPPRKATDKVPYHPTASTKPVPSGPVSATAKPAPTGPVSTTTSKSPMRTSSGPVTKAESDLLADIERLKAGKRNFEGELAKVRAELDQVLAEHVEISQRCAEMKHAVSSEERRLENLRTQIVASEQQFRDITGQVHGATARIAALRGDEQRLQHVSGELAGAEARSAELQSSIATLTAEYVSKSTEMKASIAAMTTEIETKTAEIQRLTTGSENALREFEALTANKEQMSVQLLALLKDRETNEAAFAALRTKTTEAERHLETVQQLTVARQEQVVAADRKLQEIEQQRQAAEQRLAELHDTEAKLKSTRTLLHEAEAKQSALTAALTILATRHKSNDDQVGALDKRILELRQEQSASENRLADARRELAAGERALEEFRAQSSATHKQLETARAEAETQLATRQAELAVETQNLEHARTERAELEKQCQALADTESKLAEAKAGLQKAGAQRIELDTWIKDLETKRIAAQNLVDGLHQDEEVTKGRLEVLRGREKDLRLQLDQLSDRERSERDRFEEIRRLGVEAEKEHHGRMEELQRTIEVTRRELADMEMKLAPLREWKDAMDKRYTRLASLPEDSSEARELFKEIEAEKAALQNLISVSDKGGGTRGIILGESTLRSMQPGGDETGAGAGAGAEDGKATGRLDLDKLAGKKGKLYAPEEILDAETPQERAHVGTTGTGAMLSGTGQEMALKARLTRIRESVQREAARLEFLRQERAREETRGKGGTTSGDAMLREQERQLENKVRREEEKLAALERKLENAAVEEERRRERIAEMERKLTELRADITVHERTRSDALHAADLARKELSNLEETVDRLRTMGDADPADPSKTGPVGTKTGPVTTVGGSKLKTLVSGRTDG